MDKQATQRGLYSATTARRPHLLQLDKLGNTLNADCVTRPVTVHRGGRLSTSSSGVLHLGNVAGSAGVAVPGSRVASHLLAASFGNRVAQPVADGDGVAVAVHTLSGRPLWLAVGTLERVSALAVGPSGDVLVADGEALTLALLGADGQLAARAGPALQSRPLESFDDLVDEALGAAARRGEGEGEGPGSEALLRSAGSSAPVPSEGVASLQEHLLESVSFVHADARGFWYVGETAQGRVVVLDEGLALVAVLARWGCEGQEAQGAVLGAPVGVAVDGRGRVWVADRDAGLVIAFDSLHDFSPVAGEPGGACLAEGPARVAQSDVTWCRGSPRSGGAAGTRNCRGPLQPGGPAQRSRGEGRRLHGSGGCG